MVQNLIFKNFKEKIAIIADDGTSYNYDEVYSLTEELGNYLDKGSLVLSLADNSIGSLVGYIAFISKKTPPLLLESSLNHKRIDSLLQI